MYEVFSKPQISYNHFNSYIFENRPGLILFYLFMFLVFGSRAYFIWLFF